MPTSILIVGAGELGTAILEGFSKHIAAQSPTDNASKRVARLAIMLRQESIDTADPAKQEANKQLTALGAELIPGNFVEDTVSELAAAFTGFDVVIQAGGYGLPAGTQLKSAQAALQSGVGRYFPWQFGMDYEAIGRGSSQALFDEMLDVRDLLRSQRAVGWTIVSTGLFMSFLFLKEFQIVDTAAKTVHALGGWDNRITVTMSKDIGTMIAKMVLIIPEIESINRVVYIGGDTISYTELADLLDKISQTKFQREEWDLSFLKQCLENDPENSLHKYQTVFAEGKGVSWDMSMTLNAQQSIPLTTVENYIRERIIVG